MTKFNLDTLGVRDAQYNCKNAEWDLVGFVLLEQTRGSVVAARRFPRLVNHLAQCPTDISGYLEIRDWLKPQRAELADDVIGSDRPAAEHKISVTRNVYARRSWARLFGKAHALGKVAVIIATIAAVLGVLNSIGHCCSYPRSPEVSGDIRVIAEPVHQFGVAVQTTSSQRSRLAAHGIAFSPNSRLLASASTSDGAIHLWRVEDATLKRTLNGHAESVNSVAFSPDGNLLASGSEDNEIRLWRITDGVSIGLLVGHQGDVNSVAFSPDGSLIASASADDTVRLWRAADGAPIHMLIGHEGDVNSVAFSPDGTLIASASSDETVRLWRSADGLPVRTLVGHAREVHSVAFSPDSTTLASASRDRTVRLWPLSTDSSPNSLQAQGVALAFTPDGKNLAYSRTDNSLALLRVIDAQLLTIIPARVSGTVGVAFTPDGRALAAKSQDGMIRIWNVRDP